MTEPIDNEFVEHLTDTGINFTWAFSSDLEPEQFIGKRCTMYDKEQQCNVTIGIFSHAYRVNDFIYATVEVTNPTLIHKMQSNYLDSLMGISISGNN